MKNTVRNLQKIGRDYSPLRKESRIHWVYLIRNGNTFEREYQNELDAELFTAHFVRKFQFKVFRRHKIFILYKED